MREDTRRYELFPEGTYRWKITDAEQVRDETGRTRKVLYFTTVIEDTGIKKFKYTFFSRSVEMPELLRALGYPEVEPEIFEIPEWNIFKEDIIGKEIWSEIKHETDKNKRTWARMRNIRINEDTEDVQF